MATTDSFFDLDEEDQGLACSALFSILPTKPVFAGTAAARNVLVERAVDVFSCAATYGLFRLKDGEWTTICDTMWEDLYTPAAADSPDMNAWKSSGVFEAFDVLCERIGLAVFQYFETLAVREEAGTTTTSLFYTPQKDAAQLDATLVRVARLICPPRSVRIILLGTPSDLFEVALRDVVLAATLWGTYRLDHERWQAARERLWAPLMVSAALHAALPPADAEAQLHRMAVYTAQLHGPALRAAVAREHSTSLIASEGGTRPESALAELRKAMKATVSASSAAALLSTRAAGGNTAPESSNAAVQATAALQIHVSGTAADTFYTPVHDIAQIVLNSGLFKGLVSPHKVAQLQLRARAQRLRPQPASQRAGAAATTPAAPERSVDELLAEIEGAGGSAANVSAVDGASSKTRKRKGGKRQAAGGHDSAADTAASAIAAAARTATDSSSTYVAALDATVAHETLTASVADTADGGASIASAADALPSTLTDDGRWRVDAAARLRELRAASRNHHAAVIAATTERAARTDEAERERAAATADATAASSTAQRLRREAKTMRARVVAARSALAGAAAAVAAPSAATTTAATRRAAAASATRAAAERAAAALCDEAAAAAAAEADAAAACTAAVAAVTRQAAAYAQQARDRASAAVDERDTALATVDEAVRAWRAAVGDGGESGTLLDGVTTRAMAQARAEAAAEAAALRLQLRKRTATVAAASRNKVVVGAVAAAVVEAGSGKL
jgi:trimeric autotransporter adhesin